MKKQFPAHGISMWRHFYERERTADELTDSMIRWQERWRWDFLKNNPPACYHALAWGAEYQFFDDPFKEPVLVHPVIQVEEDVKKVQVLDPTTGELGEQLKVIRNLRNHFGSDLLIFQTVFSPIEIAHRLMSGRDALTVMRKQSPKATHNLLHNITETFAGFSLKCLEAGADGIFFATKWASRDQMTWYEYVEFGTAYEMKILNALNKNNALIILHICGARTFIEQMLDYPVDAFSYDFNAEDAPEPSAILETTRKHIIGGIDPDLLGKDSSAAAQKCRQYSTLGQFIAGPSCVLPPDVSDQDIKTFLLHLR